MDTIIGLLADIADVFIDLWVNKIIGRFKKKDNTDLYKTKGSGYQLPFCFFPESVYSADHSISSSIPTM